ncbi:MAG TPA: hypothetical protein VGF14_06720 [Alphaproteobacteria bacterium]
MAKIVSAVPKLLLGYSSSSDKASVSTPVTPVTDPAADAADAAAEAAAQAEESLAQRRRGRLGTITTSFRGVLNDSNANLSRRTLLGE